jgi:hypothetical protein
VRAAPFVADASIDDHLDAVQPSRCLEEEHVVWRQPTPDDEKVHAVTIRSKSLAIPLEPEPLQTADHELAGICPGDRMRSAGKSASRQTFVTLENVIAFIVSYRCTRVEHAGAIRNTRRRSPISKPAKC